MKVVRGAWLRHGFWNTLEQGLTRSADALTGFVLIWVLHPEVFSELVLAQAWVAPTLLVFLTPEGVIYRDLAVWKQAGPDHVAARLRALRLFCFGKALLALLASFALAALLPGQARLDARFGAVLWAYALAIGPQLAGADREFLRMELHLRRLNLLTLLQKSMLLVGTVLVAFLADGRLTLLAAVAALAAVATALLGWRLTVAALTRAGASPEGLRGRLGPPPGRTLLDAVLSFSLWQHLSTVVGNWVRTMDLFVLGLVRLPARELGLYGAAWKVANLVTAAPMAATNLFAIWVGRRDAGKAGAERRRILPLSLVLLGGTAATAGILLLIVPWLLPALSHGRWSAAEIGRMRIWTDWILAGTTLFTASMIATCWLGLRTSYRGLFLSMSVPWAGIALAVYLAAAGTGGADLTAKAGVIVSLVFLGLTGLRYRRAALRVPGGDR